MLRAFLAAFVLSSLPLFASNGTDAGTRDSAPAPQKRDEVSKVDDYIRHARGGSAVIRPQAASRLVRIGKPAGERLLELAEDGDSADLALFGTYLVEIFGQFPDVPALRAELWPLVEDADFPWRPAAMRGLAWDPEAAELERFAAYTDDPIGPVRTAALDALFRLARRAREEEAEDAAAVEERFLDAAVGQLSDEIDLVRSRAAVLLDARGHARALWWLFEDLQRTDVFFERPTGLNARYNALGLFADLGLDVESYIPELPTRGAEGEPELRDGLPTNNAAALASIADQIRARVKAADARLPKERRGVVPAQVPAIARATDVDTSDVALGLELRSCRRGDFFLRWTRDDVLLVGEGLPVRIPLAEGTTARLLAAGEALQEDIGQRIFFGKPGCDVEAYRMPRANGPADYPFQLTVANDGVDRGAPRPAELSAYGALLAASIPTDAELMGADERTLDLARRVRETFAAIGGPVAARGEAKDAKD